MKLGIIGTNPISAQFMAAAQETGQYTLSAVYSRHQATADAFIAKTAPATVYLDLAAFLASDLDVVYIASPNGLHAEHTVAALAADKHVIVEKPMVTNPSQLALIEAAQAAHPQRFVFEAARHVYDPNFLVIRDWVTEHAISGATLKYAKYSSRYDAYLAGEDPNIFTPRFGGGALMDLGVYLVYAAVGWFGVPVKARYLPHLLASGVDGDGVARLSYADFDVTLLTGKTFNSDALSEIYSGRDTLTLDSPGELKHVTLVQADGTKQRLRQSTAMNPLVPEAAFFAAAFASGDHAAFARQWQLAKQVHTVMGQLREGTGIRFGNDPE